MKAPVDEIQRVFFAAMMHGYAVDGPKEILPDGSKHYVYKEVGWFVEDRFWVNVGENYSWGYILISFHNQPVWVMNYWGWYHKEVIPFLKEALRDHYGRGIFLGGRGAKLYERDGFTYKNLPTASGFMVFAGHEVIMSSCSTYGVHRYQGGLLFV